MPSDLTLPGTIPGLLRRGSPVWLLPEDGYDPQRAVVVGVAGGIASVTWWMDDHAIAICVDGVPLDEIAADLTDATARAHAAWWVADRCRPVVRWLWVHNAMGLWVQQGWDEEDREVFWQALVDGPLRLDDLDCVTVQARLLPDGSRWVDAEALRRVVAHLAGVTNAE